MTIGIGASLLVAVALGLLALACVGWNGAAAPRNPLAAFLAVGLGLGLSSCVLFVSLLALDGPSRRLPVVELVLLLALGGGALAAARRPGLRPLAAAATAPAGERGPALLRAALALAAACAAVAFGIQSATRPQGGWDAWMTWNMHARAIFRGGEHWRAVLASLPAWSHPDYPLLVSGSVVRIWAYAGRETALAPVLVGALFTFATAGVLYAGVSAIRSRMQGALAALLLLGTKFFVLHGASQFADIPLAFFFLATLVLLALPAVWPEDRPRLLLLAGVMGGLAAWTKNEGLLFLVATPLAYAAVLGRDAGWPRVLADVRSFGAGLAPVLVLVLGFKIWLAPPNDLMADHGLRQTAARLLDGARLLAVTGGFWRAYLEVGAQGLTGVLLLAYWGVAGPALPGPGRTTAKVAALTVLLMLAGYAVVLLTAPTPLLATNIRSINRLLLQVWPSMLFAFFAAARTPEEAGVFGRAAAADTNAGPPSGRSLPPAGEPT